MPDLEDVSENAYPNDGILSESLYDDDVHQKSNSSEIKISTVQTRGEDSKKLLHQYNKLWRYNVHQPPGFVDPAHPHKVYKVVKALYGLHQAPRAWYETLSSFVLENGFRRGTIDKTLFIKKNKSDIMLVQVYVDDIIFGFTQQSMCTEFEDCIYKRFQMSSMGELTFFLGLQVKKQPDGIFISQDKYVVDVLKKFDFLSIRTTTPVESNKPLVKEAFSNSDYGGASLDRKSTTGGCQFLGRRLISWQCKKQTIMANSTTEAEYVAAANCCGQVLWIQNQMMDYGFNFMNTKIHIDNASQILNQGPTSGIRAFRGTLRKKNQHNHKQPTTLSYKMSQPANDDFSQHLSDGEESNHEDASDTGAAPKQPQQMIPQTTAISNIKLPILKKEEYDIWAMEMEHYLEYI
ncbi:putative ribonuclease H-like domain-containing protein, partial [Tanacetum coccineum]